jgi:hypothetical protein
MTGVTDVTVPTVPTGGLDRAAILALVAADAEYLRPRLFAVYGIFDPVGERVPERAFLGWGIDFGGQWGAAFWNPMEQTTQLSDSAEQILRGHRRTGEAHLVWLDD